MKKKSSGKKSAVVHPGTGSGHSVKGGSTSTPMSHPKDQHGLDGRKTKGALK